MSEILGTEKDWVEGLGRFSIQGKRTKICGNVLGFRPEDFKDLWVRVFREGTDECVAEVPFQENDFESPELPEGLYEFAFVRLVGKGKERQLVLNGVEGPVLNGVEGDA